MQMVVGYSTMLAGLGTLGRHGVADVIFLSNALHYAKP